MELTNEMIKELYDAEGTETVQCKCGGYWPKDKANFCGYCGKPIQPQPETLFDVRKDPER